MSKTIRPILFIVCVFTATYAHCWQEPRINSLTIVSISNSSTLKISCDETINNPIPIEPPVGTKLPEKK